MSSLPNREQAQKLFEQVIAIRNQQQYPFTGTMEASFRAHCLDVARIAETIAEYCPHLDPDQAYVMGLLHDCGRIKDEINLKLFHGLVGYDYMTDLGYPQLARISLTHCFYCQDFDFSNYPQPKEQLLRCKELLKDIEFDDYDRLIQLADMMNDMGNICTIESRFQSISERYQIPYEKLDWAIRKLTEIKHHFDKLCDKDVYELLNINL